MSKKENPEQDNAPARFQGNSVTRRRLLKALAATGGAAAASALLPAKWTTPVAEVGLLPVHAQISPTPTPVLKAMCYVANEHDSTVSVIDTATDNVVATVPVGGAPHDVVIHPDGTRVYVAHQDEYVICIIDTLTNTVVKTLPGPYGGCDGIGVHPDGSRVYVAGGGGGTQGRLVVIDTSTDTVVDTVSTASSPWAVAVHPDGSRVYVSHCPAAPGYVKVFDALTLALLDTFDVGWYPVDMVFHPDGTRLYVACGAVWVIDTATNTVVGSVGGDCDGIGINPSGTRVYASNFMGDIVRVIDTATNTVVETVPVGRYPLEVGVHPDGSRVYVANNGSGFPPDDVSIIDTATNTVVKTVTVGKMPEGLAVGIVV